MNPLGLGSVDREIQPHEYSIVPLMTVGGRAPEVGGQVIKGHDGMAVIVIGSRVVFGQNLKMLVWQQGCVDVVTCQACHVTRQLPPPRKLMGRWEEALGMCFYWWAHHEIPRLCSRCQDKEDTIMAVFGPPGAGR